MTKIPKTLRKVDSKKDKKGNLYFYRKFGKTVYYTKFSKEFVMELEKQECHDLYKVLQKQIQKNIRGQIIYDHK